MRVQVPDMSIREMMLEVEVAMAATMEWTSLQGWHVSACAEGAFGSAAAGCF